MEDKYYVYIYNTLLKYELRTDLFEKHLTQMREEKLPKTKLRTVFTDAYKNGEIDILQYILQTYTTEMELPIDEAIDFAIEHGHGRILEMYKDLGIVFSEVQYCNHIPVWREYLDLVDNSIGNSNDEIAVEIFGENSHSIEPRIFKFYTKKLYKNNYIMDLLWDYMTENGHSENSIKTIGIICEYLDPQDVLNFIREIMDHYYPKKNEIETKFKKTNSTDGGIDSFVFANIYNHIIWKSLYMKNTHLKTNWI